MTFYLEDWDILQNVLIKILIFNACNASSAPTANQPNVITTEFGSCEGRCSFYESTFQIIWLQITHGCGLCVGDLSKSFCMLGFAGTHFLMLYFDSIGNVKFTVASPTGLGARAFGVEQCSCPAGYSGSSCEVLISVLWLKLGVNKLGPRWYSFRYSIKECTCFTSIISLCNFHQSEHSIHLCVQCLLFWVVHQLILCIFKTSIANIGKITHLGMLLGETRGSLPGHITCPYFGWPIVLTSFGITCFLMST